MQKRKPNRYSGIDYSRSGAYFLTLCIQDRRPILSEIAQDGRVLLSEYGRIVMEQIQESNRIYDNISICTYCIMPEHVHMIVLLSESCESATRENSCIPQFVSTFKRFTNKKIGFPVWQRSYYDTVLHDTQEYNAAARYIADNPRNRLEKMHLCSQFQNKSPR